MFSSSHANMDRAACSHQLILLITVSSGIISTSTKITGFTWWLLHSYFVLVSVKDKVEGKGV